MPTIELIAPVYEGPVLTADDLARLQDEILKDSPWRDISVTGTPKEQLDHIERLWNASLISDSTHVPELLRLGELLETPTDPLNKLQQDLGELRLLINQQTDRLVAIETALRQYEKIHQKTSHGHK